MTNKENKAIQLIKEANQEICFIHTSEFVDSLRDLLVNGLSESLCIDYIKTYSNFDCNGMDKGTNYNNTILAFKLPLIHTAFH